jgi:CubicO group peptidase (beta-lactamase class C family)
MERNEVAGLMIARKGAVLLEAHRGEHSADTRWVSYSIAKSVVSLLVGAAIRDGHIGSVDDAVTTYLPVLEGSAYDGVTIRDVLRMSSGVGWNEDYSDPESDVSREIHYGAVERLRFLGEKPRVAEPGTRFNYSTGEIFLTGSVVSAAVGEDLSSYLHRKIWEPFGMEADANWMLVEPGGPEYAGCCISATLRDYARLGLFVLADGELPDGTRILPEGWIEESTSPSPTNPDYGYLWWLHDDGSFSARGIFGQLIHIDPALDLVIAMHGAWPEPTDPERSAHRDAFVRAVKASLRPVITGTGVGCLRMGATAEAVRDACPVVRDTTIVLEGMAQEALRVDVGGSGAIAEIVGDRVWRISVLDAGPVTSDSIGVGTALARLAEDPGIRVYAGEGRYFAVLPERCGLSFELDGLPFGRPTWSLDQLRAAPEGARVSRVLIVEGC